MFASDESGLLRPTLLVLFALAIYYYVYLSYLPRRRLKARGISLPPGPKQKWLIGNLHQLAAAKTEPWLTFASWGKIYGTLHTSDSPVASGKRPPIQVLSYTFAC